MFAPRPIAALLWLQLRVLRQNRSACIVMLMLVAVGICLGRKPDVDRGPVCYVVYWQDDAWVEHLRSSVSKAGSMKVEVAPACQFSNENGLIVYPEGCHSIQLRPPQVANGPWRVWYWYSGDDPAAMQPATEWFWRSSREFFQDRLPLEVLASTLQPPHPLAKNVRQQTRKLMNFRQAKPLLLLLCLFFCGAYLPTLFLAEQFASRVLETLITKPIGLMGWSRSTVLFYGSLTLVVSFPIVLAFHWNTWAIWCAIVLAFSCYMGLAFVVGCVCRSVPAASSALIVYGVLNAILIAGALWWQLPPANVSLEVRLLELFSSGNAGMSQLSVLLCWSACWVTMGWMMLWRLRRQWVV